MAVACHALPAQAAQLSLGQAAGVVRAARRAAVEQAEILAAVVAMQFADRQERENLAAALAAMTEEPEEPMTPERQMGPKLAREYAENRKRLREWLEGRR